MLCSAQKCIFVDDSCLWKKKQISCVWGINRWAVTSQIKIETRSDWLARLVRWSDYVKLWKHASRRPCGSKDSNSEVLQLVYDSRCLYKERDIVRLFSFVHSYFVFVVFFPVSHFSFVRFCIYSFTFHRLVHFFLILFYSFPSSLIAVFHVLKSSFVFPLFFLFSSYVFLYFFLPFVP